MNGSLKRLQLDYVDLVYAHRPDRDTPIEETVRAFNHLIDTGKAFYWGTSEWNAEEIASAWGCAQRLNLIGPLMEQPQYNMLNRSRVERDYVLLYEQFGTGLTIWSPLKMGILTGKYNDGIPQDSRLATSKDSFTTGYVEGEVGGDDWNDNIGKVRLLKPVADKLGIDQATLAMAWVLKNPHVSSAITGPRLSQDVPHPAVFHELGIAQLASQNPAYLTLAEPQKMKRKNQDVGDRANLPVDKRRKLNDRQDSRQKGYADRNVSVSASAVYTPGLGREKRGSPAGRRKSAELLIERNRATTPMVQKEILMEPSTGHVADVPVTQRRKSSLLDEQIIELLRGSSPLGPNALYNENVLPMPPGFREVLSSYRVKGYITEATEQYYLNLRRGDSLRAPGEGVRKSFLEDVLRKDAKKTTGDGQGSGWKPGRKLGQGSYGTPLRIATKDANLDDKFFVDYNSEGNLIRRLNDVGCKNVIKVLDWFLVNKHFRTCFEFAEFGNLWRLEQWYRQRNIANALCYCRYGTNKVPSPEKSRWDHIIHGDLKQDNVLLAAPDNDSHRLYPCLKLADFGEAVPQRRASYLTDSCQATRIPWGNHEVRTRGPSIRLPRPGEFQDSYSDVYSLGVIMAAMCKHVNSFVAEPIQELLLGEKSANPSGRRLFSSYYSQQLKTLIRRCRSRSAVERPPIYDLYLETKAWMEVFRGHAYREEKEWPSAVAAGVTIYHNKVLYTKDEQTLYEESMDFREKYMDANMKPALQAEDMDVYGPERVKRKYLSLLKTVPDSILTDIPEVPDSGSEGDSDATSTGDDDGTPPERTPRAGLVNSSARVRRIRDRMNVGNILNVTTEEEEKEEEGKEKEKKKKKEEKEEKPHSRGSRTPPSRKSPTVKQT
ncbi:hypothetical protein MMC29_005310 [Sticta canariensis]|nr:hypothetical protein [Sticta canariensis]